MSEAKKKLYTKTYNAKLRCEVMAAYGNKCAGCGIVDDDVLTIDHTFGGGNAHRRELGPGNNFYRWLKANKFPKRKFRILCMNCQFKHKKGSL